MADDYQGYKPVLREVRCKIFAGDKGVPVLVSLQSLKPEPACMEIDYHKLVGKYDHSVEIVLFRRYLSDDKWEIVAGQKWREKCGIGYQTLIRGVPLGAFGPMIDRIDESCVYRLGIKADKSELQVKFINAKLTAERLHP